MHSVVVLWVCTSSAPYCFCSAAVASGESAVLLVADAAVVVMVVGVVAASVAVGTVVGVVAAAFACALALVAPVAPVVAVGPVVEPAVVAFAAPVVSLVVAVEVERMSCVGHGGLLSQSRYCCCLARRGSVVGCTSHSLPELNGVCC